MHELSIAQSILDIVNQHLPVGKTIHVKSIKVKIGKLSNVLPDSLRFCFDAITKDSDFEKTQLILNIIPITIKCNDCYKLSEIDDYVFSCPLCDSTNIKVVAGNDLNIEEIETE
jgi:hydrogenase nickel incorporation protein HypA/HybF